MEFILSAIKQFEITEILKNLLTFGITILILYGVKLFILNLLKKRESILNIRIYKIYINYIFYAILLLFIFLSFLPKVEKVITVLSLFGAGIVIVLKEIILNFFGFFYIIIRKPFIVGDRIHIQNLYGDVLDIRILDFTILQLYPLSEGGQSTGRVVHIPNSSVFLNPISNFSKEFSFNWLEIKIPLRLNSNWQLAEDLIKEIIQEVITPITQEDERLELSKKEYAIHFHKINPRTFVDFQNGCILISLRLLCVPKEQRQLKDIFWRKFLKKIETFPDIIIDEDYTYNIDF